MTDKEKLEKLKKLADAMYYAAFNLTTDASLLRKAMEEYHQFLIYKYYKEEPVSKNLEEEIEEYWKNAPTGTVYFPMWEHFQIIGVYSDTHSRNKIRLLEFFCVQRILRYCVQYCVQEYSEYRTQSRQARFAAAISFVFL